MKTFKWWPAVIGVVAAGIVVSGCGSSSSNDTTSLRVANATLTHPSLDLFVNSVVSIPKTASDTASAYVTPASGSNTLQLNDADSPTALVTSVPSLAAGGHYTLLAYESGGIVRTALLNEDTAAPAVGSASLRIYDAAISAGALDVYIIAATGTCADLSALTPNTSFGQLAAPASVSLPYSPATYRVCVTGSGNKSDLRLDFPAVTVASQQNAYVVLTPTSGGQLLNGAALIQQGAYAAVRNTNTRVRLAAAVSGGGPVAASVTSGTGTTVIDSGSVAPAFGDYTLVPAGGSLNISVNSASVGAPATALVAGSDMTLLVYGAAGAATASLLLDDNRPPSDSTTVKLRLINGITGKANNVLRFTVNSAPVASNVQPGAASGYASVTASANAMSLSLYSSQAPGTYYSTNTTLNPNTVYTVLASGDFAAPQLLIR